MKYDFLIVDQCNMCGSDSSYFKFLGRRLDKSQGLNPRKKGGISVTIYKCKKCSLIFPNPLPIPYSLEDHYGILPEKYWKKEYFKEKDNYFLHELRRLGELQPFNSGMRSLDIGAGLGKAMLALSKKGYDCFGIEPSPQFYKRAISMSNLSNERLFQASVEKADFQESFFDFITFGAVLEHLYSPSDSIAKALKWLKPNGLIHIEVPSSEWLVNKILNAYYKVTFSSFVSNVSPMHMPFHLYEFSRQSFDLNGASLGYKVAFSEYFVCSSYLPKFFDLMLKPIMKASNKGMQLSVWLRKS